MNEEKPGMEAALRKRIAELETELAFARSLISSMTPPLTDADIAAATEEAIRIRPQIEAEEAARASARERQGRDG